MDETQLTAVEKDGHWTVYIAWPNGREDYFGKYSSEREASDWIKEHLWMTDIKIDEKDNLVRRGKQSKDMGRPARVKRFKRRSLLKHP